MGPTSRRRVLAGALALGLAGNSTAATAAEDALLLALGTELARLRRRCTRLRRKAHGVGEDTLAWARWSETTDEAAVLMERIGGSRARGPAGVMIKARALAWELLEGDLIMDEAARRRMAALNRELLRLAPR